LIKVLTISCVGFGHIAVAVDNLQAACKRFDDHGVMWQKRLEDGRMVSFFLSVFFCLQTLTRAQKTVAFVKDPTGYWIEIIGQGMKD